MICIYLRIYSSININFYLSTFLKHICIACNYKYIYIYIYMYVNFRLLSCFSVDHRFLPVHQADEWREALEVVTDHLESGVGDAQMQEWCTWGDVLCHDQIVASWEAATRFLLPVPGPTNIKFTPLKIGGLFGKGSCPNLPATNFQGWCHVLLRLMLVMKTMISAIESRKRKKETSTKGLQSATGCNMVALI